MRRAAWGAAAATGVARFVGAADTTCNGGWRCADRGNWLRRRSGWRAMAVTSTSRC